MSFLKCYKHFLFVKSREFSQQSVVNKSDLSKLRKLSGVSLSKCKEALEKYPENINQAHEWLKSESVKHGWTKMGKLFERPMSNGLIGILRRENCGIMLELNCETDFVARNEKFHKLLNLTANACFDNFTKTMSIRSMHLQTEILSKMVYNNDTIENHIASTVGSLGENMLLRRAVCYKSDSEEFLSYYLHYPWSDVSSNFESTSFAKHAAMIRYRRNINEPETFEEWKEKSLQISTSISQHIVAMNPKRMGKINDENDEYNSKYHKDPNVLDDRLLFQEYFIDESKLVHEVLEQNQITVRDFIRYSCGEEE